MKQKFKALFLDIGGVILSNGWGHLSRMAAAKKFNIDYDKMDILHDFIFNVWEMGKINIDSYLDTVVFDEERDFTREEFKEFMLSESKLLPGALTWLIDWKRKNENIKIFSLNNEPREINSYRIEKFKLHDLFDGFISSCEVGMRKPDPGIFEIALGIAQVKGNECIYFDDRIMLVEAAKKVGINAFHHKDLETTKAIIESFNV